MELINLLYEVENGVGIIQVNRPKVLNALNREVLQEIDCLLDEIREDQEVRVIIITGSGDKSFVAGADIPVLQDADVREGKEFGQLGQRVFLKINHFEKPIIAAVNGFAFGGGGELAMACDFRIASEKAKFGLPEVKLGMIPGFGGTQRLPRLVGTGMAKMMIFTGEPINAQEALRIGLVQKVVAPENLMAEAKNIAATISSRSATAVRLAKAAINNGIETDIRTGMEVEAYIFSDVFATEDRMEGIAAFIEKRQPAFTGEYVKPKA